MERVHAAVLDGAARRHQRLAGHLPAEDALALLVGLGAAEDVDLDRFEVEEIDEELQGRAHRPMLPRFGAARRIRFAAGRAMRRYPAAA